MNLKNLMNNINNKKTTEYYSINFPAFLYYVAKIHEVYDKVTIIVENSIVLKNVLELLKSRNMNVLEYPEQEVAFFDSFVRSKELDKIRMKAVYNMFSDSKSIVVTTPEAALYPLSPLKNYKNNKIVLKIGQNILMEEFIDKLVEYGYERNELVNSVGEFSVRGGVVDVFPPNLEMPIRVEFFGDEIDSMRVFSIETQMSEENINSIEIRPSSLGLIFSEDRDVIIERLDALSLKSNNKQVSQKYLDLMNSIEMKSGLQYNDSMCKNIPVLYEKASNFFEYASSSIFIYWNFNNLTSEIFTRRKNWELRFETELMEMDALPEQVSLVGDVASWIDEVNKSKRVLFNPLKYYGQDICIDESIDFTFRDVSKYNKEIKLIISDLKKWLSSKYRIIYSFSQKTKLKGFINLLEDNDIDSVLFNVVKDVSQAKNGFINLIISQINRGFVSDLHKKAFITEYELYGKDIQKSNYKRKKKKTHSTFFDVEVGDYVVHKTHGIGKYLGIVQLKIENKINDYVKIAYRGEDLLYVEVEKMEFLTKYVGADLSSVRLSKLGGTQWYNTTKKVKKEVEEIALELIKLYSLRETQEGFAFSNDNEWQKDFEDAFEYEETIDQIKAINEIKEDMHSTRPMDRLLCGDVGYGKTEVALRAAFKAVNDSKQVAILVPTTILAQQHFNTIVKRFEKFPINIEMLSRFRTPKQQRKIFKDVEMGVVDIVVGTHRILSKDLHFKDLGLLIIDEEQRFGVKSKEKIKELRTNIDVLTLSATPIPRTLHMSLVGIRDMSLIEEPPEDRYPVQTYVLEYDEKIIREAVLRELRRGGQVYFVHNRIKDIEKVVGKLREILPEASIEFAHGKMDEKLLEKLMLSFMNGEFDVLVSTVIIETGLDIQNVNTIIINEAYKLGLSQLYQLKGRVGRSNRVAYAYLFYNKNMVLKEISEKRLKAIGEFTELGAGFKIAMRDLEIRGAGNVLGAKQHGHVINVGYELYTKMMEEAVQDFRGDRREKRKIDTSVDIKCSAYIADEYISDFRYKMNFYKKISSIKNHDDKLAIEAELFDINGNIPQVVQNLINISYIRALGIRSNIVEIREVGDKVFLVFNEGEQCISPKLISDILHRYNYGVLKFIVSTRSRFEYKSPKKNVTKSELLKELIEVLELISKSVNFE